MAQVPSFRAEPGIVPRYKRGDMVRLTKHADMQRHGLKAGDIGEMVSVGELNHDGTFHIVHFLTRSVANDFYVQDLWIEPVPWVAPIGNPPTQWSNQRYGESPVYSSIQAHARTLSANRENRRDAFDAMMFGSFYGDDTRSRARYEQQEAARKERDKKRLEAIATDLAREMARQLSTMHNIHMTPEQEASAAERFMDDHRVIQLYDEQEGDESRTSDG